MTLGVLVGWGIVCQTSSQELLHGTTMPRGCIGVAITECLKKDAAIPHPPNNEDEIKLLQQAMGICNCVAHKKY